MERGGWGEGREGERVEGEGERERGRDGEGERGRGERGRGAEGGEGPCKITPKCGRNGYFKLMKGPHTARRLQHRCAAVTVAIRDVTERAVVGNPAVRVSQ